MAKSLLFIEMEFAQANRQADKLDEIAANLEKTAEDKLGDTLSGIGSAWKSDTSAAYLKKGQTVQEDLRKRAKEIRKAADSVRKIAKTVYEAEKKASQIAAERKFGG